MVEGDNKREFIATLNKLVAETLDVKLIVITRHENDITKNDLTERI